MLKIFFSGLSYFISFWFILPCVWRELRELLEGLLPLASAPPGNSGLSVL